MTTAFELATRETLLGFRLARLREGRAYLRFAARLRGEAWAAYRARREAETLAELAAVRAAPGYDPALGWP